MKNIDNLHVPIGFISFSHIHIHSTYNKAGEKKYVYHFSLNTIDQQYILLTLFKFKFRFINSPIFVHYLYILRSLQCSQRKICKMLLYIKKKKRRTVTYTSVITQPLVIENPLCQHEELLV